MTQDQRVRGHTGQPVVESGTYQCEDQTRWSYVEGDVFRACPSTGKATVWEKTTEPRHADSR